MIVRIAREGDVDAYLELAGQVEEWFGPMVGEPGFRGSVERHIRRAGALVAVSGESEIVGGLMFSVKVPVYHIDWLVVSERQRGGGVGKALMSEAVRRFAEPGTAEVVTFGVDHPGAVVSGARAFYRGLGFTPGEAAPNGPEGGSRQVFRRTLP